MVKKKSATKSVKSTKTTAKPKAKKSIITKPKATGLGDTVEAVLKATGVDKVAKWILGEDCGCQARKTTLNRLFPYKKPNCLTEEEFLYLNEWFSLKRNSVTNEQQKALVTISNRIFDENAKTSSCTSCFLRSVQSRLKVIHAEYIKEKE
tara:strand:+ start:163 stop:612 length:450 start_codon:yes stop_codon:yes gene_type:complete